MTDQIPVHLHFDGTDTDGISEYQPGETIHTQFIGDLPASKITSGTFANARISQSNILQHQGNIDHNVLLNYDVEEHRRIEDGLTTVTNLWSASKINNELSAKTDIGHTHAASDVVSGTFANARISQGSVTQHQAAIDHNALLNYDVAHHRTINDASISTTDLWSANKITTELATKASVSHSHSGSDITSGTISAAYLPVSSTTQAGIIETATTAEVVSGLSTTLAATPAGVAAALANASIPKRYMTGPGLQFVTTTKFNIKAGMLCKDSTHTYTLETNTNLTINTGASGVNGLDTGSFSSLRWYFVYMIGDSTGTNPTAGIISLANEQVSGSITLPAGYNIKRQLPWAICSDSSARIVEFSSAILIGPTAGLMQYATTYSFYNGSSYLAGTVTNVLNNGTATTDTAVGCSVYVPPIATKAHMHFFHGGNTASFAVNKNGGATQGFHVGGWDAPSITFKLMDLDSAQKFQYRRTTGTGSLYADVDGYVAEVS